MANALFVGVTGYKMLIKVHYFLQQRKEYRALVHEFRHSLKFRPQNEDEEKYV